MMLWLNTPMRWLGRPDRLPFLPILLFVVLLAGCTFSPSTAPSNLDTLFQTSTLSALQAGVYDGELTIGQLKQHGDFGLGTFSALAGEMVMADGEVYRMDAQGVLHVVDDAATTPFAAVTFFEPDESTPLHAAFTCPQLQSYLDARLPLHNVPYALRVAGSFTSLTVRSVAAQHKPYPPLDDALAKQVVFEEKNISGALIGFRLPAYLAGANVAGYHFHFISDDRQVGGHVLACTTDSVTVSVDNIEDVQVELLQQAAFAPSTNGDPAAQSDSEPLVLFGAYGTSLEEPWNQAIHRALLAAEEAGDIRYSYAEQVGFSGQLDQVLRTAIAERSPAIIVGDAFGNEEAVAAIAKEHPEIAFVFGSDEGPHGPNVATFDSWTHEAAYLAGMLAGGLTDSNVVGVVAGYPEGSVNRVVNAFIAGAQAVNPNVDVRTTFINSWFDPDAAAATAQTQIAAGADVIFGERTGVIQAAAAAGVYVIGNMIDQTADAPNTVVSSVVWNLRPTLDYVIDQVRNGSYTAQDLTDFSTLAAGGAQLAPLNQDVAGGIPADLAAQIEAKAAEITSGRFVVSVDGREPPASVPAPDIADTTPAAEAAPIKIGVLNPTSGPLAPFGQDVNVGIERFFEAAGGEVNGRPVALIMGDTGGDAEQAVAAAQRLVDDAGVDLLMGIVNSSAAGPVADFADERQIPLVITIAGAEGVTGPARSPYVFRTAMANGQQERPLAAYLATQIGRQRAATIAWDFPAGAERSAAFADAFIDAGGVVVQTLQPPLGTDDFGVYLDALDPNEIDLLYAFLTGPQAADFMHQLRQRAGFADLLVVGPGYLTAGVLPQMGADALPIMQASEYTSAIDTHEHNAVIQSLLSDASRALPSYAEKVRATSDVYVMEGYLGASVVAQALTAIDGDVENGGRFLEALAAVDFASVSGPFRFDAQGQAVRNLYITELVAGSTGEIGPELREVFQDVSQNAASRHQPEQMQAGLPAIAIPLDHPSAPFLESYRYAVQAGATAEWRKMEGVAYDPVSNRLYVAMSEVNQGMTDGHGDIDVAANPCGAIYAADLDADYDLIELHAIISGGPYEENAPDNSCSIDNIANPDNLAVDSRGNLWIAEDSDAHANNMLWMFDGETLHRYATLPVGAEVTGLHIDANDTLFMNTSHPDGANLYPYNRALTGVIQGYRAGAEFASLPLAQGDARHAIQLAAGVYQPLGRTGETIPHSAHGHRFGQITLADGAVNLCNRADGNMYLPTNAAGSEGYLFTNYECAPGGVSMLYIRQGADGEWKVLEGDMVDFMAVNGSWRNCFASVTPWNTALSSEEAPPDVNAAWIETHKPMSDYLGRLANPYDYGYTMELTPGQLGADVTKHYVMGRTSHEISLVMPDARTVYQSDDGSDRLLWKFVADVAGDLTAGTLYAAKATQRDAVDGGKFTIEWIELGSSDNARIGADIRQLDAAIAELE